MFAIRFRQKGRRSWRYLTSKGGGNRLRIHAARFDSREKAQAVIDESAAENADFEMEVCPIT